MLSIIIFVLFGIVAGVQVHPNFVIILTDDQDVVLDGMKPMEKVQQLIADEGVTFTNSFTTSPVCCPSRSSFLSGLYVHNHMAHNNSVSGGCNGRMWRTIEHQTFAVALDYLGYNTFYAGKYLNQYGSKETGGPEVVPPSWTDWHGLVGNSRYYNYTLSHNGEPVHYDDVYLPDLIKNLSLNFLEKQEESQPFLMVLAPPSPHAPFTPAPRHEGAYVNQTTFKGPNYNISVDDKHWLMSMPPSPLPGSLEPELNRVYRSRWETLLAVDEMVADVIEVLEKRNFLDDTYVIYTSDNGYHIGQFSQVYDKRQPYESDIRVPLLIRGPGIKKNTTNHQPVLNIDIAPTLLSMVGLEHQIMDGKPIDFDSYEKEIEERHMLIEYYGEGNNSTVDPSCPWKYDFDELSECYPAYDCKCQDSRNNTYACVRHVANWTEFKYCLFEQSESFEEVYDLKKDPFELINIAHETLPSIKTWYKYLLSRLLACKGFRRCEKLIKSHFDFFYKSPRYGGEDYVEVW